MMVTDSYNDILRMFNQAPDNTGTLLEAYNSLLTSKNHSPSLENQVNLFQQYSQQQQQQHTSLQQQLPPTTMIQHSNNNYNSNQNGNHNSNHSYNVNSSSNHNNYNNSNYTNSNSYNSNNNQYTSSNNQYTSTNNHYNSSNNNNHTNSNNNKGTTKGASPTCNEVKDIFSMADMFQVTEACGGGNGYSYSSPKMHSKNGGIGRKKINYFLKFGEYGTGPGQFTEPSGVCSNDAGEFLVADTNNHRIQIFNHEGEFLRQIGDGQKTDGPLVYPNRVAVCPKTGNIIVTERPPSKQVQVFTADGSFVRRFGSNIIMHPRGLAVDQDGRIIVLESKVMRTLIYDEFGTLEQTFECPDINFANSVAVNSHREIFITDNRSHCVKVFDYVGNLLRQIGGDGITNFPIGVNIGPNGEVLVADNHNNFNVTIFDREGNLISAVESKVKHAQCFDVTLTSDGSVVVASKDYRLYVYRFPLELFIRSGTASRVSRSTAPSPHILPQNILPQNILPQNILPQNILPQNIFSNGLSSITNSILNNNPLNGNINYSNIALNNQTPFNEDSKRLVEAYNMLTSNLTNPPPITPFPTSHPLPTGLSNTISNGLSKAPGNKRVSPTCTEVKDIFSMADMFQVTEEFGGRGLLTPKSSSSSSGGIGRKKINYFLKFGEYGTGPGQFTEPSGVCSNEAGEFLVADTNNHRIQIFNHEGEFLRQIGDESDGVKESKHEAFKGDCSKEERMRGEGIKHKGPLVYPNRVAVCPKTGNIIVTERPPSKQVQVFTADGKFVRRFGSNVIMHPRGLTVDKNGKIIVLESKVMRTLIHDEFGTLENSFDCPEVNFANSIAVNAFNEIFITDNRCHCVKVFDYNGNRLREIGGEGITNFPIGVNIGPNGEVLVADNHNNFNVTIFDRDGNLISAVESKVKHAQCFDVTLTSDGSVVVASKDYRLYVYRFPLELFIRSGSSISRSTSSSPPSLLNTVPSFFPPPNTKELELNGVSKGFVGCGRKKTHENGHDDLSATLYQPFPPQNSISRPARMITNNTFNNNGLKTESANNNSNNSSPFPILPSDLNDANSQNIDFNKIGLLHFDNYLNNNNLNNNNDINNFLGNNNLGNNNLNNFNPSNSLQQQPFESNFPQQPQQSLIDNLLSSNNSNLYNHLSNNYTSNYNNTNTNTMLQNNSNSSNLQHYLNQASLFMNNNNNTNFNYNTPNYNNNLNNNYNNNLFNHTNNTNNDMFQ